MAREYGINYVNKDERGVPPEVKKGKLWKYRFLLNPSWILSIMVTFLGAGLFLTNLDPIETGFNLWWLRMTGLQLTTLFLSSFLFNGILFLYFFLTMYFTRGIVGTIMWAKMMGKRLIFHKGRDKVFKFRIPDTDENEWTLEGIGRFTVNEGAVGWLENGIIMMPTVYGHNEGIDYDDIKHRLGLLTDPTQVEDRIKSAIVKAKLEEKKTFDPKALMWLIPLVMVIGISGYLIITNLQQGQCQAKLIEMTQLAVANVPHAGQTVISNGTQVSVVTTTTLPQTIAQQVVTGMTGNS